MATEPIKVYGWREFNRNLRRLDAQLPKALRLAGNEAAQIVVDWAQPRVPRRSGAAAATYKARSTRTAARVSAGSNKVPYVAWLDYGGRVGRRAAVRREYIKEGRYLYPGYAENAGKVRAVLVAALHKVADEAGLEVTF